MEKSKKIVLPVHIKDANGNGHEKEVHYDCDFIRGKNIRDWDEDGKVVPNRCVIFSTLKFTKDGDFAVIALSRSTLVAKLEKAGVMQVIS